MFSINRKKLGKVEFKISFDQLKKFNKILKYIKSHPIYNTSKVKQFTYVTGNGPEGSVRPEGPLQETISGREAALNSRRNKIW